MSFPRCVYILFVLLAFMIGSCKKYEEKSVRNASYIVDVNDSLISIPMLYWDIWGPFQCDEDSINVASISKDGRLSDAIVPDHVTQNGIYSPKYGQLDLREVYDILPEDTVSTIDSCFTYLSASIVSSEQYRLFLHLRCQMPTVICVNGDTLTRMDIDGHNFYAMNVKSGKNNITMRLNTIGEDWSIEADIVNENVLTERYAEGQVCNIVYPLVSSKDKSVWLTNRHQNLIDKPVILSFYDAVGKKVSDVELEKGKQKYIIPNIVDGKSYICTMQVGNNIIRQPIYCGSEDTAYNEYQSKSNSLPDDHIRKPEIDGILFRLGFLLNHPSRKDDWWWQFKIAPLIYQLENIFEHADETYGMCDSEFNVKYITYQSEQDDSLQHYLLVTPDNYYYSKEQMPLVVIIRPFCEIRHPFLASPQLARQWALNIVQYLSNKYGYIVMMPEARMLQSEDLTPEAEQEVLLAIKDVMSHYRIDRQKIFLHANCTGGYRALKLAEKHPDYFAAIALYAPVYQIDFQDGASKTYTAKSGLPALRNVPLMIHYDPLDGHSTYGQFEDLIQDCRKCNVPLTLSVKRNSGKFYNVVIAGQEAFEFYCKILHRY